MTIEMARAIGDVTRQMNEQARRIDNLYANLHNEDATNINDNEDGLAELGESNSDNSDALIELAKLVSDLEVRVKALEGKVI